MLSEKIIIKMVLVFDDDVVEAFANQFEHHAFVLFRNGREPESQAVADRRYRGWVGCSTSVTAMIWILLLENLDDTKPEEATMERLLWALLLLHSCDTEINNASRVGGVDEATFSTWSSHFVNEISNLESQVARLPIVCSIAFQTFYLLFATHFCRSIGTIA